jgi:hypothetical protein
MGRSTDRVLLDDVPVGLVSAGAISTHLQHVRKAMNPGLIDIKARVSPMGKIYAARKS